MEEGVYESEDSEGIAENNNMQDSIRHIRNIRSREYSNSTTRSQNQLGKISQTNNGMPTNHEIQEIFRDIHNNKRSRKDYSKRTRVSVLDSSLSSLMKNSTVGDHQLLENQNRDPNLRVKSNSSVGSNQGNHYFTNTNPRFQFNKYKDSKQSVVNDKTARSIHFSEFNSPNLAHNSNSHTPQSQSRDLNITRKYF